MPVKMLAFQMHLDMNDCEFRNLTNAFKHRVYRHKKSLKKVTVPNHPFLDWDLVETICKYLKIRMIEKQYDIPIEILKQEQEQKKAK